MKHVEGDINKKIPSGEKKKKRYNVLQMLKQTTTKNSW